MWKVLFLAFVVSLPVAAEEKVWYCEMTGYATANASGDQVFKLEKFKMKVSSKEVVFGSGGFFHNSVMPIAFWLDANMWNAINETSKTHFKNGQFYFAQSSYDIAVAISARCDDF